MHQPDIVLLFSAPGGGTQSSQVELANALAAKGLRVVCLMPKAIGPFLERLREDVEVVSLGTRKQMRVIVRLAQFMKRRPRVIIASQHHMVVAAVVARALVRAHGVRIIGVQHNPLSSACGEGASQKMRRLMPLLVRLLYRPDAACAVSQGVADDLAQMAGLPRPDITVIPSIALPRDVMALCAKRTGLPWLDHGNTTPVVLSVGNLRPVKDYGTLLAAFARLRLRGRKARLIILGEGNAAPLQEFADRHGIGTDVNFPGHQMNPFAYMARAHVFALSSRHEGFSNVLVEAMACGCPVVSTDCPYGPREILDHGRYGRLVPVGDVGAMADALDGMLNGHAFSKDMLRRRAAEFSIDRIVGRYLDLLGQETPAAARHVLAA